jgi:hypothetical protein
MIGLGVLLPVVVFGAVAAWVLISSIFEPEKKPEPNKEQQAAPMTAKPKTSAPSSPHAVPSQTRQAAKYQLTGEVTIEVGDNYVNFLEDLVGGLYKGTIPEDFALNCVVMPDAQTGDLVVALSGITIYHLRAGVSEPLWEFGVKSATKNDDPLHSAPIRYTGRQTFRTQNGLVKSVPVFEVVSPP